MKLKIKFSLSDKGLKQDMDYVITEFYRLSMTLKNDDNDIKNYIIVRLVTIIEQVFRHAVEHKILTTQSLDWVEDEITIKKKTLMEMTDATKERIISFSYNFQNIEIIKNTIKKIYDKDIFTCNGDNLLEHSCKELLDMRHEIVHTVMRTGENISKHYNTTERVIENACYVIYNDKSMFYRYKVSALHTLGMNRKMIDCLNELLALDPDDLFSYIHLDPLLKERKCYKEREELFNKGMMHFTNEIKLNSKNAHAYFGQGILFKSIEKYEKAVECFNQAINLEPDTTYYLHKGKLLMELERYNSAIKCFHKLIQLDPEFSDAYIFKGNAYEKLGRSRTAMTLYNKAIKTDPENYYAYLAKGGILAKLSRYKKATECFNLAIKLNPTIDIAYAYKSDMLVHLNDLEGALGCVDKAIQIEPNFHAYHMDKGSILKKMGKITDAESCFKKSTELQTNESNSKNLVKG